MMIFPLLAVSFIMKVVAVLFVICSVVLVLIILVQKGKGGGLSGAFGGGMASGILGSKTGDFLTWVTMALVGVFLILAVIMAKFYKPTISDYGEGQPTQQSQPVQQSQPDNPVQ
ncbi:MAG: preprotein translocase subunit SecG [Planctomycetes bacterium]|nr:preprotein translocase subunit SecG [Planctomycetota bacterium]